MIVLPLYCTTPGNVGDLFNLVPMKPSPDKLKIKIIQGHERFLQVNIEEKV
jgi:hypothetical protein